MLLVPRDGVEAGPRAVPHPGDCKRRQSHRAVQVPARKRNFGGGERCWLRGTAVRGQVAREEGQKSTPNARAKPTTLCVRLAHVNACASSRATRRTKHTCLAANVPGVHEAPEPGNARRRGFHAI